MHREREKIGMSLGLLKLELREPHLGALLCDGET